METAPDKLDLEENTSSSAGEDGGFIPEAEVIFKNNATVEFSKSNFTPVELSDTILSVLKMNKEMLQ